MFPGCAYTLTTWYTPAQIHSRMTIFYVGASGSVMLIRVHPSFTYITGSV
jgi:hypothetical protein